MSSGDAVIRKLPSVPVAVPLVVPCSITVTPTIGAPDASVTFPVTVWRGCAAATPIVNSISADTNSIRHLLSLEFCLMVFQVKR